MHRHNLPFIFLLLLFSPLLPSQATEAGQAMPAAVRRCLQLQFPRSSVPPRGYLLIHAHPHMASYPRMVEVMEEWAATPEAKGVAVGIVLPTTDGLEACPLPGRAHTILDRGRRIYRKLTGVAERHGFHVFVFDVCGRLVYDGISLDHARAAAERVAGGLRAADLAERAGQVRQAKAQLMEWLETEDNRHFHRAVDSLVEIRDLPPLQLRHIFTHVFEFCFTNREEEIPFLLDQWIGAAEEAMPISGVDASWAHSREERTLFSDAEAGRKYDQSFWKLIHSMLRPTLSYMVDFGLRDYYGQLITRQAGDDSLFMFLRWIRTEVIP